MKNGVLKFTLLSICLSAGLSALFNPGEARAERIFSVESTPTAADWRWFHAMPFHKQKALWDTASRQGKRLSDWSWEWRLAWLRACATSTDRWCDDLTRGALFDRALVVRAEAAAKLGERYADTKDRSLVALLEKAYRDPRNTRNGRPVFIGERILFAMKRVGGDHARDAATRLAGASPETRDYWKRVSRL